MCMVVTGRLLAALAGLGAAATAAAPMPPWRPGPAGDLAFQASGFMRATSYARPDRMGIRAAPDGANGLNIAWEAGTADHWLIEEQRFAFDPIAAGLATHRQDLVERGERMLDWGFRHERPDGSFDCPDAFHSTSFFVEAVAHVLLLIGASDLVAANEAWMASARPRLRASARWMMRPDVAGPGLAEDERFGHRFFLDGAALGEAGTLLDDPAMRYMGRMIVRRGVAAQDPNGINPERGGPDTSYQAVGLLLAETYYTLAADGTERAMLEPAIGRGLGWLATRVRSDGTVDQAGNTRTGFGQERSPEGRAKTMSYGSAVRAAWYWGMVTGDPRWAALAEQLRRGQRVDNAARAAASPTG